MLIYVSQNHNHPSRTVINISDEPIVILMTSELVFVGLGLSGTDGMTVKALNALKECDKIYAEFYTSFLIGTKVEDLEAAIGKKIKVLYRAQVEENDDIIKDALEMRVGFVTAGAGVPQ